jgi:N-acetylmuramoyl-L-alanine amidase
MDRPPPRERETQELIRRFQAKRARGRQLRLVAAGLGGALFVAAVVVAVVLTAHTSGSQADNGPDGGTGPATSSTLSAGGIVASSTAASSAGGTTASATTASSGATSATANTSATTTTAGGATTTAHVTTTVRVTTTAGVTTTTPAGSTTSEPHSTSTTAAHTGKVVVIDPGHQAHGDSSLEPVGPGSSDKKAKVSDGTSGVATGTPESVLVLAVSLKLRDALEARGIKVVMTRTTQDVNLSNIQRAEIANRAGADLFVRVHADGATTAATAGIHVLYPVSIKGWTDDIAVASKKAASLAQRELIAATGANDRGIDARGDMSGFNWSDVPAIIPEIGFMTNAAEDRLLATAAYQDKIVAGLTRAIVSFLGVG